MSLDDIVVNYGITDVTKVKQSERVVINNINCDVSIIICVDDVGSNEWYYGVNTKKFFPTSDDIAEEVILVCLLLDSQVFMNC